MRHFGTARLRSVGGTLGQRVQVLAWWIEKLGWFLVFAGFPLGNTTVGLAVLAVAALLRLGAPAKHDGEQLPAADSFDRWGWLFFGVTVVSALHSSDVVMGLATSLAFFLLFTLLVRGSAVLVNSPPYFQSRHVAITVLVAGLIGSLYAAYTYFGLGRSRAVGLSVETNSWGTVSAFLVLLALGYIAYYRRRNRRLTVLAGAVALTALTSLILTFSRGAWLAFGASLVLLLLFRVLAGRIGWQQVLAVVVAGAVGAGVLFAFAPKVQERFLSAFSYESNRDRVVVWEASLRMIADHPWLGVGGGGFPAVYDEYRTDGRTHTMSFAHNIVLQIAAEFGILGLVAFTGFVGTAVRRGWTVARRSGMMMQAIYAGYVGMLLHDLVDNITYGMNVGGLFWLLTGLFVHMHRRLQQEGALPREIVEKGGGVLEQASLGFARE